MGLLKRRLKGDSNQKISARTGSADTRPRKNSAKDSPKGSSQDGKRRRTGHGGRPDDKGRSKGQKGGKPPRENKNRKKKSFADSFAEKAEGANMTRVAPGAHRRKTLKKRKEMQGDAG
jgi:hypothetical protein